MSNMHQAFQQRLAELDKNLPSTLSTAAGATTTTLTTTASEAAAGKAGSPRRSSSSTVASATSSSTSSPLFKAPRRDPGDMMEVDEAAHTPHVARQLDMEFSPQQSPQPAESGPVDPTVEGRIGPPIVMADLGESAGDIHTQFDRLEIESRSNFCSFRANVCVFKGKWMYEVVLGTSGIQQLGFCTLSCPFTNEEGVGDSQDSFAYDGKRMKKWNVDCTTYGQEWTAGDVIGCCIDLDQHHISYYRNGISMGLAFDFSDKFSRNGVAAYFPAISLSYGERSLLNFGTLPFIYPVQSYSPFQSPGALISRSLSMPNALARVRYLFEAYERAMPQLVAASCLPTKVPLSPLARPPSRSTSSTSPSLSLSPSSFSESSPRFLSREDAFIVAATIFTEAAPLLVDPYVIANVVIPFLLRISSPSTNSEFIQCYLRHLVACLEDFELEQHVQALMLLIALRCRISAFALEEHSGPFPYLSLALNLLSNRTFYAYWVHSPAFSFSLEGMLTVKQPTAADLKSLLPTVWWPSSVQTNLQSAQAPAQHQMKVSEGTLRRAVAAVEDLHTRLLALVLLDECPIPPPRSSSLTTMVPRSPQSMARSWLRGLLKKNKSIPRNPQSQQQQPDISDPTALSSTFFALISLLHQYLIDRPDSVSSFEWRIFVDPSGELIDTSINRVGGAFSYLAKTCPIGQSPSSPLNIPLYTELFDDAISLYYLSVFQRYRAAGTLLQSQTRSIEFLEDVLRRNAVSNEKHLPVQKKVYEDELLEKVRLTAWRRITLFSDSKQDIIYQLVVFALDLIDHVSSSDGCFPYLPELYVEALVDAVEKVLRGGDPPYNLTLSSRCGGLHKLMSFLIRSFHDSRVVNPELKEFLLQSLTALLRDGGIFAEAQHIDTVRQSLLPILLEHFDARYWVSILKILPILCKGVVLGSDSPPTDAALMFLHSFRDTCLSSPALLNAFINRLLTDSAWLTTELGVYMKKVEAAYNRSAGSSRRSSGAAPDFDQIHKHLLTLFELTCAALSVLEVMALEMAWVFVTPPSPSSAPRDPLQPPQSYDTNTDINLTRLLELVCHVVNQTASATGPDAALFDRIIAMEEKRRSDQEAIQPPSAFIQRGPVLKPLLGILLNLAQSTSVDTVARAFTQQLAFNIAAGEYLFKCDTWAGSCKEWLKGTLADLPAALLSAIQKESSAIKERSEAESSSEQLGGNSDDDICAICYASPQDSTLEPCQHRSCRKCIDRHLLNNKRCFFCNADVVSVTRDKR
eukprot:CAMPEP_0184658454 /NCGR_PEP_ID=MMETSP0308-20130426/25442_1 /TAXON_ID=38269 /ORGANISM="Gloeochaete witrockiana, Strain SAG 46.84" /LENGTH=1254 /DNA_ID=CAMNT_0027097437 /DNA_START=197 /DNA_END=3961 /DNA_ORIENTATION=+